MTGLTLQFSQRRDFHADDFGAVGNLVADDTASLNDAITAANAAGGGYVIAPRTYSIRTSGGLIHRENVWIRGGPGALIRQEVWGSWGTLGLGPVIRSTGGSIGATAATLTADTVIGQGTLTVGSTAGLAVGSMYLLGCNLSFGSEDPTNYRGEQVRVKTIDSGTQVTLSGLTRDIYTVAAGATLQLLTFARSLGIEDMMFENLEPGLHTSSLVEFYACQDPHLVNCSQIGSDHMGAGFDTCLRPYVDTFTCTDFSDDAANGRYGYGVDMLCATEHATVRHLTGTRVRHAMTCDGIAARRGVVRHVTVDTSTATETTSAGFDTHNNCEDITYTACRGVNIPLQPAMQVRGRNVKVRGFDAENVACGVIAFNDAHGLLVQGGSLRRIVFASGFGHAIHLRGCNDAVVEGTDINAVYGAGIACLSTQSNMRIHANTIANCGQGNVAGFKAGVVLACSTGTIANASITDNLFVRQTSSPGEPQIGSANMNYGIFNGVASSTTGLAMHYNVGRNMTTGILSDADSGTNPAPTGNIHG